MHFLEAKRIIRYIEGTIEYGVNSRSMRISSCMYSHMVIGLDPLTT